MTSTKFILSLMGVVGLLAAAFTGKFTGDLGLYVAGIIGAYVAGNTVITKSALASGKAPPP